MSDSRVALLGIVTVIRHAGRGDASDRHGQAWRAPRRLHRRALAGASALIMELQIAAMALAALALAGSGEPQGRGWSRRARAAMTLVAIVYLGSAVVEAGLDLTAAPEEERSWGIHG